jgi:hypothetical protein
MDATGNALVAWLQGDHLIQARARTASGKFRPIETISEVGREAGVPNVAMDPAGNALIVWRYYDTLIVHARTRSAAGVLGPIETLSEVGHDSGGQQIAMNANGDTVIVWMNSTRPGELLIKARARSAAGVLGPIETLSEPGQRAFYPQVAIDAAGNTLTVWSRSDGTNDRIEARARSAVGELGLVQRLSAAGTNARGPDVAMHADGSAVVVWTRRAGRGEILQSRTRSAAGVYGPVQRLSKGGEHAEAAQVAVDGAGGALVVWKNYDRAHGSRIIAKADDE